MNEETVICEKCGMKEFVYDKVVEAMKLHRKECDGERVPRRRFEKGDKVQYSDYGKAMLTPYRQERTGEIAGFSHANPHCVRVRWDGNKSAQAYAQIYIKHVEEANKE